MRRVAMVISLSTMFFGGSYAMAQETAVEESVPQASPSSPEGEVAEPGEAAPATAEAGESESSPATAEAGESESSPATEAGTGAEVQDKVLTQALLNKQIKEVGTSVDTLKEDTFSTKSRLLLLREEVLQRAVSGARLQIRHKNAMGGQYEMVQIYYGVDQQPVYTRQDTSGALDKIDDEIVSDKMVAPGAHQLNVLYVYKGKKWGVFRYMQTYTFRVESGYDFIVDEGKSAVLTVTASEKGNAFTAYEKRPYVTYHLEQTALVSAEAVTGESSSQATSR